MSAPYEEIVQGEVLLRLPPDGRHERICARLHERVGASVIALNSTRLLARRDVVQVSPGSLMRPDLSLVTSATGKLWLAVEIISSQDHRPDTVMKKSIYDEANLPRLWMVDPRYDNVEVYHGTPYGLALKRILANAEILEEPLLPGFGFVIKELFAP